MNFIGLIIGSERVKIFFMSYLTDLNLQNWKDQGFLKLSNIFNTDELDKINLWIEKIRLLFK